MPLFNLQPGKIHCSDTGRIQTYLGSCVSITLWHPIFKVGAMSHFLLPSRGFPDNVILDGKYGDESFALLTQELLDLSIPIMECQAKVFGGGNMFPHRIIQECDTIGYKNSMFARSLLTAARIPIVAESLFQTGHRNIIFDIPTGYVWMKHNTI